MSGRTILSRPRTRIYDANYNMGQNYYKPALDSIDRKYFPKAKSPLRAASVAQDIFNRHDEAFASEDLDTVRRRAEKKITENHLFDSRGGRIAHRALEALENDIDEETASTLKRIGRVTKKVSINDRASADFENTVDNLNSQRLINRSEKILRSVGLDETARRALDEDVSFKKRTLKVTYDGDAGDLVKWTPLRRPEPEEESGAVARARQSRDRILDLEDEMAAIAEKQVARERRAARFKALLAESTEETEAAQSAIQAVSLRTRREQRIE